MNFGMSVTAFAKERWGVEVTEEVERSDVVAVYRGVLTGEKRKKIVLHIKKVSNREIDRVEDEAYSFQRLSHPNIINILSQDFITIADSPYLILLLENYDFSLAQEFEMRQSTRRFWTEGELHFFIVALASAHAKMQSAGLSHRNVRPENVFIYPGGVKVGNFGFASDLKKEAAAKGNAYYFLSPLQRKALSDRRLKHNSMKSDVFSFGMMVLAMAKLEIMRNLGEEDEAEILEAEIASIRYSEDFKRTLRWCLTIPESGRCSFLDLHYSLHPMLVNPNSSAQLTHSPSKSVRRFLSINTSKPFQQDSLTFTARSFASLTDELHEHDKG